LAVADNLAQLGGLRLEVERLQALLDGRGAHVAIEVLAEPVAHLPVQHLVTLEVLNLEVLKPGPDLFEPVEIALSAVADLPDLTLGALLDLAARVGLRALGLKLRDVLLELAHALLDLVVAPLLQLLAL